jgi:hypothetical protein
MNKRAQQLTASVFTKWDIISRYDVFVHSDHRIIL